MPRLTYTHLNFQLHKLDEHELQFSLAYFDPIAIRDAWCTKQLESFGITIKMVGLVVEFANSNSQWPN